MMDTNPTANRLRGIYEGIQGEARRGIVLEGIAELNRLHEALEQLVEAAESLGVVPEGAVAPCFCPFCPRAPDREDPDDAHVGECRDMRGALRKAGRRWERPEDLEDLEDLDE